ncbi:hypothetical protein [Halolactibacillus sp. JCM 19043]|uniref:hypothetical protein n=1 Tax=Halolactibacillus sp. JCM 19043 TaxID=1460638 RepID=UPI0012E2F5E7|nr:hypothetical protein [Halolactibacillus sp. JCM 19043]
MTHVFITDQGRVRPYNEDTGGVVCNQDKQALYIIADGMGGIMREMLLAQWCSSIFKRIGRKNND